MTETVAVNVETIEQWKSVLDVWFEQGYEWLDSLQDYREDRFDIGSRQLALNVWEKDEISCFLKNNCNEENLIEYEDFMAQQEKTMTKETYYVTQEQLDLIEMVRKSEFPIYELIMMSGFRKLVKDFKSKEDKDLLKYLDGDTSIEFKVKEQLYRLWRIDDDGDRVYMYFEFGTPTYTLDKNEAFTATREAIEKHKTVYWEIEKAN